MSLNFCLLASALGDSHLNIFPCIRQLPIRRELEGELSSKWFASLHSFDLFARATVMVRDDDEKPEREFEAHTWWEPIQEKWGGSGAGTCRLFFCSFALSTGRRLKFRYFYTQSPNKKNLKFLSLFQFCLQATVDHLCEKRAYTVVTANLGRT